MKMILRTCLIVGIGLIAAAASAATWYVDADNYGKGGLDGTTEATAFGTILDATTNSLLSANDTIRVLPGVYDKGLNVDKSCGRSRVAILTAGVRLESTGGKDVTHIVGAFDPTSGGLGEEAIRCVFAPRAGVVVKGFTLRNGATANTSKDTGRGGAFDATSATTSSLVDCVVSNNVSFYGAIFGGTAYRVEFTANESVANGVIVGHSSQYHTCLIHDNGRGADYLVWSVTAVNSTFACNNASQGVHGRGTAVGSMNFYNTVIADGEKVYPYNTETKSRDDRLMVIDHSAITNGYALVAPAIGDFRVRAGSLADGGAAFANLDKVAIPSDEPLCDLEGTPYSADAAIHMGALQKTVEVAGGRLEIGSESSVNGGLVHRHSSYLYPTEYPTVYRVKTCFDDGSPVYAYMVSQAVRNWRYPESDDALTVAPPPLDGLYDYLYVRGIKATQELYVEKPENGGSDATGDGSQDKPYETIQTAVNAVSANAIIHVGPGTYTGSAVYPQYGGKDVTSYGKCVVPVYYKSARIVGTAGAENTVLVGVADSSYADDATLPGCGPNAGRCLVFRGDNGCGIQGFTLTGGHSARSGSAVSWGGAWYSDNGTAVIADCIVSNNVAAISAAGCMGVLTRLYVADNKGTGATLANNPTIVTASVFDNNPAAESSVGELGDNVSAYGCTLVGPGSDTAATVSASSSAKLYNLIATGYATLTENAVCGDVIAWDIASFSGRNGVSSHDPCFVSRTDGDYRVKTYSPALSAGLSRFSDVGYQYVATDFTGKPIAPTETCTVAGAYQTPVAPTGAEAYIEVPANGGYAIISGNVGLNELSDGEKLVVKPADGTRPCVGYLVNGVTNLFSSLDDGVLEISATDASAAGGMYVMPLYDATNWYVACNDERASDTENPGCAAFPFKTLACAMSHAASGDTVHAAAGDYNDGLMGDSVTTVISSRVVVATGVTLKADEGPEKTFITGANATVGAKTSGTYAGCGSNAVRCVRMLNESLIEGFTIRHGRFNGESPDTDDSRSGGIYGKSAVNCVAVNCTMEDNWGFRGGQGYGVRFINSRFIGGKSNQGTQGQGCAYNGCFIGTPTYGGGIYRPNNTYGVANSTFVVTNAKSTVMASLEKSASGQPFTNCIFVGTLNFESDRPARFVNCLYTVAPTNYVAYENSRLVTLDDLKLGEGGILGAGSAAIDQGLNAAISDELGDVDCQGGQRIYNGTVDIGANEFDYRPTYAATLNESVCTVESASPETVLGDDAIVLTGTLKARLANASSGSTSTFFKLPVRVTGKGALTVMVNERVLAELSAEDGLMELKFKSALDANSVVFAYEQGDDETGAAEIGTIDARAYGLVLQVF